MVSGWSLGGVGVVYVVDDVRYSVSFFCFATVRLFIAIALAGNLQLDLYIFWL